MDSRYAFPSVWIVILTFLTVWKKWIHLLTHIVEQETLELSCDDSFCISSDGVQQVRLKLVYAQYKTVPDLEDIELCPQRH